MKDFNFAEDVVSTEVVVTDGIGDGGIGVLAGTDLITSSLSPQELKVIVNRFGLLDGVLRTQKEVAIFLGISSQRVSQIESKATKKIKIARCLENLFEKK